MFLLYKQALALSILTLTGSLLYGMESTQKREEQPQERRLMPQVEEGVVNSFVYTSTVPGDNTPSVLLVRNKTGSWTAIPNKSSDNTLQLALGYPKMKEKEEVKRAEAFKKLRVRISEGDEISYLNIMPIEYKSVEDLKKAVTPQSSIDNFAWVSAEKFTGDVGAPVEVIGVRPIEPRTRNEIQTAVFKIQFLGGTPAYVSERPIETTSSNYSLYKKIPLGGGSLNSVALSADGKTALITKIYEKTATLLDTTTGEQLQLLEGHTSEVTSAALSANGDIALTGSSDRTAILWDTRSLITVVKDVEVSISSVALSKDSKIALIGLVNNTVVVWDTNTEEYKTLRGHTHRINSIALSANGKIALTGSEDNTARVWNTETGETLQVFKKHVSPVISVALSADGRIALTGSSDQTARLWDTETGNEIQVFKGHTGTVRSVALSADGKTALTGSSDRTAILWDAATGKELQKFTVDRGIRSVAFDLSSNVIVIGSSGGITIEKRTI